MRFGLCAATQHATWDRLLTVWRVADQIPLFESAWTFDHVHLYPEHLLAAGEAEGQPTSMSCSSAHLATMRATSKRLPGSWDHLEKPAAEPPSVTRRLTVQAVRGVLHLRRSRRIVIQKADWATWFAELHHQIDQAGTHRSVKELAASIRAWITNWNDDPKPLVRHKTADEFLHQPRRTWSADT